MKLDGQRVVIIGGSSGIGLETAQQALAEGALVTVAGRSEERLRQAAERLGNSPQENTTKGAPDRLRCVVADLADEGSVRALFAAETRVDHVFVPAGELRPESGDVLQSHPDRLQSVLDVRLLGVAHAMRHARSKMKSGSVTLMSGLYAIRPGKASAMAAAAVAAVEGMTRALALDLAPVRVNAVAPGVIDTPLWDAFGAQRDAVLARAAALPVGRIGRPDEVAAAVIFLMTNGFVTGTVLRIDGGGALV
jgi:NAD(P)-dependent dehydrogenase (short-subunit alcohol dehydrogenase family)